MMEYTYFQIRVSKPSKIMKIVLTLDSFGATIKMI